MTDYFKHKGRALLSNGYLILPIKPGEKRPAISSWQKARLGVADLDSHAGHGVGIICGQGAYPIVGIDIDVSHPVLSNSLLEWCRKWLPGPAPERVGRHPRTMLVFRAPEAGWTKGSSTSFVSEGEPAEQKVEVLGFGQQFVAYAVHPDTQREYDWIDWLGGLEAVKASDLPLITEENLSCLMAEVDRLVRSTSGVTLKAHGELGRPVNGTEVDWLAGLVPPTGTSIADTTALLSFYREFDDYENWLKVGMALHHEYHGSEEAFKVWSDWSAASAKHDMTVLRAKWPSFGKITGRAPTTLRWLLKVAGAAKRDAEVAALRDVIDSIKFRIAAATDAVQMTGAIAKAIKPLIPNDPAAHAEVYGAFQNKFKALAQIPISLPEVRKLLAPTRAPTVRARRPLTEFGNAERMLDRYADGLMFVPELEQWYKWTGVYWRKCPEIEIHHYAKETIRALTNESDDHEGSADFFEFCKASQQARMVKSMVLLASSDPRVAVPASRLDEHWWLVGVMNGVVDLKTGVLLPASPEHRITTCCGAEYLPGARAPLFVQTLVDVFQNDLETMNFFHRLIGYTFTGNPIEDVMVIPFGNGSNGKSTVLNAIREAFGGYAKTSSAETFVSAGSGPGSGGGGAREDLVRLKGARMVYSSEPEENSELRESAVKSMSGGDAVPARGLWSRSTIEIEPSWVVYMPTNHKPIVKGNDNGIWRRMVLLPFLVNFDDLPANSPMKKDPDRRERLMAEKAGILTWIVEGAMRYLRVGLEVPGVVNKARDEYRTQMDLLAEWLEECCEIGPAFEESSARLWISWEAWARRNGCLQYVKSSIALGRRLEIKFRTIKSNRGIRMKKGLRLRPDEGPFKNNGLPE